MGIKLTNNAFATLAAGINSSATSITLTSGQGARFPTLGASDYFYATLIDTSNNLEIVKCTARSTDVLTVVRAQESTTARAYSTGDRIEIRITAATFVDATSLPSQTGNSGKFLSTNGTDPSWATVSITAAAVSDQTNSSTGYFDLPSGTTAQRPTGAAGMIRHNSSNGFIEYWDTNSSQWIGIGAVAATGGTVTTYTGFKAHTFTASGTLTVQSAGLVDYVIVAGGGAGGCWHAGGGGAGGMLTGSVSVSAGTYSIVIGGGGAGGTSSVGNNGSDTTAFGLTAIGGGRGGNYNTTQPASGGSGAGGNGFSGFETAGSGTAGQGNSGGNGNGSHYGGGGGGKGAAGETAVSGTRAGNGGIGGATVIRTGSSEYYSGGGGGGVWNNANYGTGGSGGGGNGSYNGNTNAPTPGAANSGGGGGGSGSQGNVTSYAAQTTGGSGIVIIRYIT